MEKSQERNTLVYQALKILMESPGIALPDFLNMLQVDKETLFSVLDVISSEGYARNIELLRGGRGNKILIVYYDSTIVTEKGIRFMNEHSLMSKDNPARVISTGVQGIVDTIKNYYAENATEIITLYNELTREERRYQSKAFEELEYYRDNTDILITTATDTETFILHKHCTPLPGETLCVRIFADNVVYYFAKLGRYNIAHVQSKAGSFSERGSYYVVGKAIQLIQPALVLSLGIAFGVSPEKQKIGDVMLASKVAPFGRGTMMPDGVHIKDPEIIPTDDYLFQRFKSFATVMNTTKNKVHEGMLVTGEYVVDDPDYKKKILAPFAYFNVIGGEMEALGVYRRAEEQSIKCSTVKAVCDYAEGKNALSDNPDENELMKDGIQLMAMKNVCLLAQTLFNDENVFSDLKKKQ